MKRSEILLGFGDFQTPSELAAQVLRFVRARGVNPGRILEPTCGAGSFVDASYATWPRGLVEVIGLEINPAYNSRLTQIASNHDTFRFDYADAQTLESDDLRWNSTEPLLICGNLPWVTTDNLSRLADSYQQRIRDNPKGLKGLDALTGAGSYDISERLALRFITVAAREKRAHIAFLLKESVARRVLLFAKDLITNAAVVEIDSARWFGVKVQSCLLYLHFEKDGAQRLTTVDHYRDFENRSGQWTLERGVVRRDSLDRTPVLKRNTSVTWRHGIKHDASEVFEFAADRSDGSTIEATNGTKLDLESAYLYPFLTARNLHHSSQFSAVEKYLFVPQRKLGDRSIESDPKARREREYIASVRGRLGDRRSSIYRNRPPYAVFGIGAYTFARYKVAVAGLYMKPNFRFLGSINGRPCVLGDTSYFVPCDDAVDAALLTALGNADATKIQIRDMAFAGKRPITKKILDSLGFESALSLVSPALLVETVRQCVTSWGGDKIPVPSPKVIMDHAESLFSRFAP